MPFARDDLLTLFFLSLFLWQMLSLPVRLRWSLATRWLFSSTANRTVGDRAILTTAASWPPWAKSSSWRSTTVSEFWVSYSPLVKRSSYIRGPYFYTKKNKQNKRSALFWSPAATTTPTNYSRLIDGQFKQMWAFSLDGINPKREGGNLK